MRAKKLCPDPGSRIQLRDGSYAKYHAGGCRREGAPYNLDWSSGCPKIFTEKAIRAMIQFVERPIIFPLSNPTSKCEAAPADLIAWTDPGMFLAASEELASISPALKTEGALLFPAPEQVRDIVKKLGFIIAKQAMKEKVAPMIGDEALRKAIEDTFWTPKYPSIHQ